METDLYKLFMNGKLWQTVLSADNEPSIQFILQY